MVVGKHWHNRVIDGLHGIRDNNRGDNINTIHIFIFSKIESVVNIDILLSSLLVTMSGSTDANAQLQRPNNFIAKPRSATFKPHRVRGASEKTHGEELQARIRVYVESEKRNAYAKMYAHFCKEADAGKRKCQLKTENDNIITFDSVGAFGNNPTAAVISYGRAAFIPELIEQFDDEGVKIVKSNLVVGHGIVCYEASW